VHIGKATVDKLNDLRQAAREENIEVDLPDDLVRVERVGQFQQLVELTEQSQELKHKVGGGGGGGGGVAPGCVGLCALCR